MPAALIAACLWALAASGIAMLPRRFHWPGAVALIGTGIPLLGWVTAAEGPLWGLGLMLAGASVLRWPLIHLAARLRRRG